MNIRDEESLEADKNSEQSFDEQMTQKLQELTDGYSEKPNVKRAAEEREKAKEIKEAEAKGGDALVKQDLKGLAEGSEATTIAPNGYIPVRLSTKGFLGAPKLFHIKAFDSSDLTNLALSEQEDLPIKIIELFDNLIYEDDVTVADFAEDEVVELIIVMIRSFISRYIRDIPYDITDEDKEFQAKFFGGKDTEGYKAWLDSIENKVLKPKITIDIDSLKYHEVDENTKTIVKIQNSVTGFSAKFSYPRYGDVAVLKKFLDNYFSEKDRRYAKIVAIQRRKLELENEAFTKKTDINIRHLPGITPEEEKELKEYDFEKAGVMVQALKALHLKELNGKDVSNLSLGDKVDLVLKEPGYTHEIFTQVTNYFDQNLKVGINTDSVMYQNPITNRRGEHRFPFRLDYLLQTLRDTSSDYTSIDFE